MRRLATFAAPAVVIASLALTSCMPQPTPPSIFPLYFQDFSARLDDQGEQVVKAAADYANAHPTYRITVLGFADPTGSVQANIDISRTRAQVVSDGLVAAGVTMGRIRRDALGATPFAFSAIESRRVEIDISAN